RLPPPAGEGGPAPGSPQVGANLWPNARVHTPVGTTVIASVEATEAACVIRVRDDGPGIPQHLLPSVFERFTRGDVSRARGGPTEGGSGLGLAIVEAVTVAHGGRIHVESAPGRTEFTLELPPAEGARTPDPATTPATTPAPASA
ncbi:sensor histidine kinase, partial [Streptomyces sp. NPDC127044]